MYSVIDRDNKRKKIKHQLKIFKNTYLYEFPSTTARACLMNIPLRATKSDDVTPNPTPVTDSVPSNCSWSTPRKNPPATIPQHKITQRDTVLRRIVTENITVNTMVRERATWGEKEAF